MPNPARRKRPLTLRLKIVLISTLSFLVTTACSLLRPRTTPEPMCYKMVVPTDTPTPIVMCYEVALPTGTATPTPPTSPLPTPTPTSTLEARRLLLEGLLAEGRFPNGVARQLES